MVLYGLNENLRSYKSLKKGANFRLSPALTNPLKPSNAKAYNTEHLRRTISPSESDGFQCPCLTHREVVEIAEYIFLTKRITCDEVFQYGFYLTSTAVCKKKKKIQSSYD